MKRERQSAKTCARHQIMSATSTTELVTAINRALDTHATLRARSDVDGSATAMETYGIYDLEQLDAVLRDAPRSLQLSTEIGTHAPSSFISILAGQRTAPTALPAAKPLPVKPCIDVRGRMGVILFE